MQSQPSYRAPKEPRSPWFYVLWGCGGCACLGGLVAVIGVIYIGSQVKQTFEVMARAAKADLKVHDHKMVDKQGERYIAGSLQNISPTHTYMMANISFDLLDKSGKVLTSTTARTKDLKPGATWEFKAPVIDPTAVNYKFGGVTGFQDVAEDPSVDPATRQKLKAQRASMEKQMQDLMNKTQDNTPK